MWFNRQFPFGWLYINEDNVSIWYLKIEQNLVQSHNL